MYAARMAVLTPATVSTPAAVPTLADAGAAAAAIIAAGAEEVLLFGSVAAGTATPHSDIDLVAVFADIDYRHRPARQRDLQAAAEVAAAPWPVHVHVTDRPEWRARIEKVVTSFERRIAGEVIVLATATERGHVRWDKEMVLPMSDPQEAVRQFDHWVLPRLSELAAATLAGLEERDQHLPTAVRERARLERMVRVCTAAALATETTIKALAVLYGNPTPSDRELRRAGHDVAACLELVPEPARSGAATALTRYSIDVATLSQWRLRGTYTADISADGDVADGLAGAYTAAATALVRFLAGRLQDKLDAGPELATAVARCELLSRDIAGRDVRLGGVAPPAP